MTTYVEVAQALVSSGYLSEADLDAATTLLADALVVSTAQETKATALKDEAFQEAIIAEAKERALEAEIVGDYEGEMTADEMMVEAQTAELQDDMIIANAEATMAARLQRCGGSPAGGRVD